MGKLIRVQNRGQVTIPTHLRKEAGIADGDVVVATLQRGRIVLTPQFVVDRSGFPSAEGDYTPAQRRAIDARLAQARKGQVRGPFDTAGEMVTAIEAELRKRAAHKKLTPSR
jgi:bifunctional DNA-binding transcriptional regulator/antitoxin component of YhaV-PrlF toxin-antitoxin module